MSQQSKTRATAPHCRPWMITGTIADMQNVEGRPYDVGGSEYRSHLFLFRIHACFNSQTPANQFRRGSQSVAEFLVVVWIDDQKVLHQIGDVGCQLAYRNLTGSGSVCVPAHALGHDEQLARLSSHHRLAVHVDDTAVANFQQSAHVTDQVVVLIR